MGDNVVDLVRGGCAGQSGGAHPAGKGLGGPGGGAVYLIAPLIQVTGTINASGAGGGGGVGGRYTGGGGGGAGGLIAFDTTNLVASTAFIVAHGGGAVAGAHKTMAEPAGAPIRTHPRSPRPVACRGRRRVSSAALARCRARSRVRPAALRPASRAAVEVAAPPARSGSPARSAALGLPCRRRRSPSSDPRTLPWFLG